MGISNLHSHVPASVRTRWAGKAQMEHPPCGVGGTRSPRKSIHMQSGCGRIIWYRDEKRLRSCFDYDTASKRGEEEWLGVNTPAHTPTCVQWITLKLVADLTTHKVTGRAELRNLIKQPIMVYAPTETPFPHQQVW